MDKRDDRAGRSRLVAIIKVIGGRVVEIHRFLDQPQTEQTAVKIVVGLRIARDRTDVMETGEGRVHGGHKNRFGL